MNIIATITNPQKTEAEPNEAKDNHKVQGNKVRDEYYFKKINYLICKSAHDIKFFIIAILIAISLKAYGLKRKAAIINVLFVVLLIAVLSEFYQSFVTGITFRVEDVLIDFSGGVIGVLLYRIYNYIKVINHK